MEPCFKVCTSYIITTLLIAIFVFAVLSNNSHNSKKVNRLQEELDDIAHTIRQASDSCAPAKRSSDPDSGSNTKCSAGALDCAVMREVNNVVETLLKRKMANVWDDLYTMKKQLQGSGCKIFNKDFTPSERGAVTTPVSRVNYASEDLGAKIISVKAAPVSGTNIMKSILGLEYSANPPINMLRPSMEPGSCFAFKGKEATVTIRLAQEIIIESISLSHIAKELSPTVCTDSAPKDFQLYGIAGKECKRQEVLCGKFTYDNSPKKRTQEYAIKAKMKFAALRLKFLSNHGHPNYTCIYRLAVYGKMI